MSTPIQILPVIMSGGAGSRLWPLSNQKEPKQFLPLNSDLTMLQETVQRLEGDTFLAPVFIAGQDHVDLIQSQMAAIETKAGAIIIEPMGRNTAACAAVACAYAAKAHPGALVLMAPADHVIGKPEAFRRAILQAAKTAAAGHHVTFGIAPDYPATGFGYIKRGAAMGGGIFAIDRFVEKPDAETAAAYLSEGGYDWNGGIFLFNPALVVDELSAFAPGVVGPAINALETAQKRGNVIALDPDHFAKAESLPVDIALMERTSKGAVVPCGIAWADIGSYSSFRDLHAESDTPVIRGDGFTVDSQGSLIDTDGPMVAVIGLDNVGVIVRGGRVLVVSLDQDQNVKQVVEHLKSTDRQDLL